MRKNIYIAAIAALSVLSCILFYSYMRLKEKSVDAMLTLETSASEVFGDLDAEAGTEKTVMFYICGEVAKPDVYTLPAGSRIIDAIELAGGATDSASFELMESVAGQIVDGQKIYVPNEADDIDKINYMNNNNINTQFAERKAKDPDVIVNINTADIEELCKISGIGEATAKLICDYREENGNFVLIEDIMNVPKIGEKTFESIKKNITVE